MSIINRFLSVTLLMLLVIAAPCRADEFADTLSGLSDMSFSKKAAIINTLQNSDHPEVIPVLSALMEGQLYYRKSDKRIVYVSDSAEGYALKDAATAEDLGSVGTREVSKITVNNSLRSQLRTMIAGLRLTTKDDTQRLAAATELARSANPELLPQIEAALSQEANDEIRDALLLAKAMVDISSETAEKRLSAIEVFGTSLDTEITAILVRISTHNEDGSYNDPDETVRAKAREALTSIENRTTFYKMLENLFFGVSMGSVLLLAAVGLAITFGVMGVINMAHGEMIMLGAYTTYVVQQLMPNHIGASLFVAIPAAFVVSGLVGIAIERGVIRHLYGRPLETLLATFGISLILQQAVRSLFSPLNRQVQSPEWMSGFWQVNGALSITYNRLFIVIFSLLVLVALALLLRKTFVGLQMRAVTQNRAMARSMGIRSGWVDALTFGLGSGIAGIAGVALSQLTNVGPNLGQAYIVDSFMVVVFGGVGNILGTFFAAMSLGIANKFLEPWSGAVMAKIIVLIFIILFIQKRPRGMFALKGRSVEG